MITISRSAVATRKLCPMKRYWAYHAPHPDLPVETQVGGLTPVTEGSALAKLRGQWFHTLMAHVIRGRDLDAAIADEGGRPDTLPLEQHVLIRRAIRGWLQVRGTALLADYAVQSTEAEWEWSLDPLVTQTLRLDAILRHRETDRLLILDYKTLARPDTNWIDRLRDSDQTHLYLQALTERTEELGIAMQYEGIILGTFDAETQQQKSPFVSAYHKHGVLSPTWSAGSTRVSTLDWADDEWLTWITPVLPSLYCTTGPLAPPPDQLLATKRATLHAELQWADTLAQLDAVPDEYTRAYLREALIERHPDSCLKYGKGHACPYVPLCWHGAYPDIDTYQSRTDHHAPKEGSHE